MPLTGCTPWLLAAVSTWLCGCQTSQLSEPIHLHVAPLRAAARPVPGSATGQPAFSASDDIEQHDSAGGFFRVHYTQRGQHAVPTRDGDGDGVPDFVNSVAADFDTVLDFYKGLGYRTPESDADLTGENGGDGRFDVYLLDFPNAGADGQFVPDGDCSEPAAGGCSGYMMLENDFVGRGYNSVELAIRLVASHELFHAVQQAYATDIDGWLSEGSAVWASEAFDAEAGDLERQAATYLARPQSSLATTPPGTDPIRYGGGLFFELIDEHAGRERLRQMWDRLADTGEAWPIALDAVLQAHDSSLAQQYATFVEWNLFTGERADPERAYAHGDMLASVDERAVDWGFRDDSVRVLPLSARYYALRAEEAQTLAVAAVLPAPSTEQRDNADADDVEHLGMLVAVEHDARIERVVHADSARTRSLMIALEAGDTAHVALFNTRIEGGSIRPDLCIGTQADAEACTQAASDAETSTDAGITADVPSSEESSGCAIRPARRSRGGFALGAWAVGLWLGWWRRRQSRS